MTSRARISPVSRSSLPMPRLRRWRAALIVSSLGLLTFLWWQGGSSKARLPWKGSDWFRSGLARIFSGIALMISFGNSSVTMAIRLAALGILIVFAWALRRWLIARNAYLPGPVDVKDLSDGVPEAAEVATIKWRVMPLTSLAPS